MTPYYLKFAEATPIRFFEDDDSGSTELAEVLPAIALAKEQALRKQKNDS